MARDFNSGLSEYLERDAAPVAAYPFTVACWFRSTSVAAAQILWALQDKDVANVYHQLALRGDLAGDPVQIVSRNTTQRETNTSTAYSANTWHHACGVWAAAQDRRVFIDGGSKGTDTTNSVAIGAMDRVSIGRAGDSTPGTHMAGRIGECVLWNVALTDAEVAALARGVSPYRVRPGNIVAHWDLPARTGNAADAAGHGHLLTDFNTVGVADHPPVAPVFAFQDAPVPTTVSGAQTLTPTPAVAKFVVPTPTVTPGGVTLTPSPAVAKFQVPTPTVTPGTVTLTPSAAVARFVVPTPSVVNGVFVTPSPVVARFTVPTPTLTPGGVTLTPSPALARWLVPTGTWAVGGRILAPTPVVAWWRVPTPSVTSGGITPGGRAPYGVLVGGGLHAAPQGTLGATVGGGLGVEIG